VDMGSGRKDVRWSVGQRPVQLARPFLFTVWEGMGGQRSGGEGFDY
jgi:hypothetical protein